MVSHKRTVRQPRGLPHFRTVSDVRRHIRRRSCSSDDEERSQDFDDLFVSERLVKRFARCVRTAKAGGKVGSVNSTLRDIGLTSVNPGDECLASGREAWSGKSPIQAG